MARKNLFRERNGRLELDEEELDAALAPLRPETGRGEGSPENPMNFTLEEAEGEKERREGVRTPLPRAEHIKEVQDNVESRPKPTPPIRRDTRGGADKTAEPERNLPLTGRMGFISPKVPGAPGHGQGRELRPNEEKQGGRETRRRMQLEEAEPGFLRRLLAELSGDRHTVDYVEGAPDRLRARFAQEDAEAARRAEAARAASLRDLNSAETRRLTETFGRAGIDVRGLTGEQILQTVPALSRRQTALDTTEARLGGQNYRAELGEAGRDRRQGAGFENQAERDARLQGYNQENIRLRASLRRRVASGQSPQAAVAAEAADTGRTVEDIYADLTGASAQDAAVLREAGRDPMATRIQGAQLGAVRPSMTEQSPEQLRNDTLAYARASAPVMEVENALNDLARASQGATETEWAAASYASQIRDPLQRRATLAVIPGVDSHRAGMLANAIGRFNAENVHRISGASYTMGEVAQSLSNLGQGQFIDPDMAQQEIENARRRIDEERQLLNRSYAHVINAPTDARTGGVVPPPASVNAPDVAARRGAPAGGSTPRPGPQLSPEGDALILPDETRITDPDIVARARARLGVQ